MSDLSGRTLFKRIKPLIKVFVIVDSYLPRKLNNFLYVILEDFYNHFISKQF